MKTTNTQGLTLTPRPEIESYFHCRLCLEEGCSPQALEVGWTEQGVQVWCRGHQRNVVHIDFRGQRVVTR